MVRSLLVEVEEGEGYGKDEDEVGGGVVVGGLEEEGCCLVT